MRLLLVEDDAMVGRSLKLGLEQEGYSVDWTRDGEAAEAALRGTEYALVLLDLGLQRMDGLTLLRALRARQDATPVLIVTARDTVSEKVDGLDAGADDYLVKPFSFEELAARLRALLRRPPDTSEPVLSLGSLRVNPATHQVSLEGQPVHLAAREYALLQALLRRPGLPRSRAQLEESIYGWGSEVESNAIEVHIHALRRKLGPQRIETVRGVGYRLVLPP